MSKSDVRRITLSMPSSVVSDLDLLSSSLGVSRSAFVSALLGDVLPPLVPLTKIVSPESSGADSRRYRGEFAEELRSMVGRLNSGFEELQDDLFKE